MLIVHGQCISCTSSKPPPSHPSRREKGRGQYQQGSLLAPHLDLIVWEVHAPFPTTEDEQLGLGTLRKERKLTLWNNITQHSDFIWTFWQEPVWQEHTDDLRGTTRNFDWDYQVSFYFPFPSTSYNSSPLLYAFLAYHFPSNHTFAVLARKGNRKSSVACRLRDCCDFNLECHRDRGPK